jgi:hypothetical protein
MKCPRCVQTLTPAAGACPHCGYAMAVACGFYGEGSVVAEQLMDVESRLSEEERQAIRQTFAGFSAQFPQLFFMMYLGTLPAPASPRQFAFWLLNHAAVPGLDVLLPNERGLLLVVDPQAGSAVLATGYFPETFVAEAELDAVLRSARKELGRADYPAAVEVMMGALGAVLRKKAKQAERHPAAFRPAAPAPAAFPRLVRTGEPILHETSLLEPEVPVVPHGTAPRHAAVPEEAAPPSPAPRTVRRLKGPARRHPPRRS